MSGPVFDVAAQTAVLTNLIGVYCLDRHACHGDVHLPNCYNHQLGPQGSTACVCGQVWWRGNPGTWHSRQLQITDSFTLTGRPVYKVLGWDRYFLHADGCADRPPVPDEGHLCCGLVSMTYAEATAWEPRTPGGES